MQGRRSENHTGPGWGIAAIVVIGAIVVNAFVAYIHYSTSSRHPTDPMYRAVGSAPAAHAPAHE
jgi:hypothetical protein